MNQNDENTAFGSYVLQSKASLSARSNSAFVLTKQQPTLLSRAPLSNISNNVQQPSKQQPIEQKNVVKLSLLSGIPALNTQKTNMCASPDKLVQSNQLSSHLPHTAPRNLPESPKIDAQHANDPQHVTEFVHDIVEHYKKIETKYMATPNYMEKQTDISASMRSILFDWLVDVHHKFKLRQDTLYLTFNIIDRFLCKRLVARERLQLLGIASMLIASKYEEIYCPEIDCFVQISAGAFKKEEILRMEKVILTTLDFNVTVATNLPFLRRYLKCGKSDAQVQFMAHYFSELALGEYQSLQYTPSLMACACILIANKFANVPDIWNRNLQYYTGRQKEELEECSQFIMDTLKRSSKSKLIAVKSKYCSKSRGEVAKVVAKAISSGVTF